MSMKAEDLRTVLDIVALAHTGDGELPAAVLPEIGSLVGGDSVSFNRIDHTATQLLGTSAYPAESDISRSKLFHQMLGRHPGFQAYRTGRLLPGQSVALSDMLGPAALRANDLYAEFYRPRGTRDQLMNAVRVTARHGAVLIVNRPRRGFSARDRDVLNTLAPHLAQVLAWRQRITELTAAVRSAGRQTDRLTEAAVGLRSLTIRERDVVEHVANGDTDREIARALGIGHRTAHKHLEQIYRKLGIGNRTSLVAAVHRTVEPRLDEATSA
jgi:DNA-binding CsgD family transcriptional regulator